MALPVNAVKDTNNAAAPTYHQNLAAPPAAANRAANPAGYGAADHIDKENVPTQTAAPEQLATEGTEDKKRKRRFGLFPLLVLLPMAAAFAFGVWNTPAERTDKYAKTTLPPALKSEKLPNMATSTPSAETEGGTVQLANKPWTKTCGKRPKTRY
jgi:hypothetical protein